MGLLKGNLKMGMTHENALIVSYYQEGRGRRLSSKARHCLADLSVLGNYLINKSRHL